MAVLAIDQGTSGTKALVVADDGRPLSVAETPLRPDYLDGGGVEQDPAALLASVLETGRRAIEQAGTSVSAVAVANQGESVLAWDRDSGRPLSPVIVWQDRRADPQCHARASDRRRIEQRTGLVLDSYFSAPKMSWLRDNITRSGVVTTTDSWIVHQLTGAFVTDRTTASRSLLADLDHGGWDTELLDLFGLAGEDMPEIIDNDTIVGSTDAFGPPMAVGGLIVDQQASLLAQHCLVAGTAKCTFGTGVFMLAHTGSVPVRSSVGLTSSVASAVRNTTGYCLDGQVYTAASAVRWLEDLGLISTPKELDSAAAEESAGAKCVPAFAGLAAPWWRSDAMASFTGLTLSTGRGHLIAAVLEGIAAQTAELVDSTVFDLGRPLSSLRVDGGLTASQRLMQATADLTQLPVEVYPNVHATALGAGACARMAWDPSISIEDAIGSRAPARIYEPRWSPDRAIEFRKQWRDAAEASLLRGVH
ncbi:FGGY family carbohydrate kinase [Nocardia salmonicida]